MNLLCASLLLTLLRQHAQGATHFLYQKMRKKVQMTCQHNTWKIDTNYNQNVNCEISIKNEQDSSESNEDNGKCRVFPEICKNHRKTKKSFKNSCLEVHKPEKHNGFFACVSSSQAQHNTFKSLFSNDSQNDYYILAYENPNVVMPFPNMRQDSTIKIHEGESITLMCSFNITKNFYNKPYVVYWMKTSSKSSEVTCVYSYSYSGNKMSHYNYHCPSSKSLLNRVSNNTLDKPNENIHSHNLIINKSTHLDSGQYACALNVIKGNRGNWAVLNNITMSVDKKEPSDPGTTRKTTFVMAANPTQTVDQPLSEPHGRLTPLYLTVSLLVISIILIAIYMKKRAIISQESHFGNDQRQNCGERASNPDCSPYLVSGRELEPYSVVQLAAPPADSVERDQSELSAEPYSIVMQNSLYEASGPSQGDKDSSKPRTEHLAGNMKQPEGAVDTGAHVYEVIKDTNSTC